MGNNNQKHALRKAQSIPESQFLEATNPDLKRSSKTRSSARILRRGKSEDNLDSAAHQNHSPNVTQSPIPLVEALFLPDFPVRGDIEDQEFEIIEIIAKGAYGNVVKVRREDEKQVYAMKVMNKTQIIVENAIQQCKDEASIQTSVGDHPFIVKLHEYWQSRKCLYIVLDYVPHGDLFTLWTFHGFFPEKIVRVYIAELAMILDYLHKAGVIYRDIKMENLLFDPNGHIQLIDFGLAKWLSRGQRTRTVCGTLQYMAPEVLSMTPYGHTADWWSLGILMYAMLTGAYPADGASNHEEMAKKVEDCDYLLPGHISDKAQDLVDRLLTKNPNKRLTDLLGFQNTTLYRTFNFSSLSEKKVSPKELVPDDFFPMTGVCYSYAPPDPTLHQPSTPLSNQPGTPTTPQDETFAKFDFVWNLPPDAEPVFV